MKLIIKNRLMTLKGGSTVQDDKGEDIFKVKGKFMSWTKKKYICDLEDNVLFVVRNRLWRKLLHSVFIYDGEKNKLGELKSELSFKTAYEFISDTENIKIIKDTEDRGLAIHKDDEVIATFTWGGSLMRDSFEVDCYSDANAALVISLIIGMDNIKDNTIDD